MSHLPSASNRAVLLAILVIVGSYGFAAWAGWPQEVARQHAEYLHVQGNHGGAERAEEGAPGYRPHALAVLPFVALLLAIAVLPLVPSLSAWWDNNLHRLYVAVGLGAIALAYYLLIYEHPVPFHWPVHRAPGEGAGGVQTAAAVLVNAVFAEYIPFTLLLFTLYTVSGGIRIEGDLQARPSTNAAFLIVGSVLASFIGTTGAAMLLVRPLLETNHQRRHVVHTMVFFIFIVCNCGGCLLPLGDPPLFLGYLRGVPFFWTLRLVLEWLFVNAILIAVYYLWDRFVAYPRESVGERQLDANQVRRLRIEGLWPNAALFVGVVASISLLDPNKAFPGTDWYPWVYLREVAELLFVAVSLGLGNAEARRKNQFNYHAILEVAALFLGIFLTMQPALQILDVEGPNLGLNTPAKFFWATGSLSSVLDNAPTYVVFFETARSLGGQPGDTLVAGVHEPLLIAVSLGAVLMGAMTYIGNGPNFMVRAIAEQSGVRMPSFFGYLLYSMAILIPTYSAMVWLFLPR